MNVDCCHPSSPTLPGGLSSVRDTNGHCVQASFCSCSLPGSYSGVGLGIERCLITMALEVTHALNPSPRCSLQSNDRHFSRCM